MSSIPLTSASYSNLDPIFNSALQTYKKKTGKDITSHPLATELQSCNSPDAILTVLRKQVPSLNQSQDSDGAFTKWLIPTVNVLFAFSATVSEGVGLVFSPAKTIFAGIGVLLLAAKDVNASRDTLINLFKRIEFFFRRLEIYTAVPPTIAMTDIIIEIMVEVLTVLGIATKEMKRGRMKKYLQKLVGNTEAEDSLERLDKLTQEEARMASVELLKITHRVEGKVKGVDDRVEDVRSDVQDVGQKVEDVNKRVESVDEKMQAVNDRAQGVDDKVQDIDDKVDDVGGKVLVVDDKLDQVNRNQLRDNLLRWLSPSDPSINHNIALKAHHDGTAQWFFRGSIYKNWKSTGSFLWMHGKPGSGKSVICSSIIEDIIALHDAGKASMAYFYFDFRDVDKQKLSNVLPSLLIQLSAGFEPCCDILSHLYSKHDRGVRKPNDRAMIECLKEMVTVDVQMPTYIIMDALDECPITFSVPSPREEVLDLVDELVGLQLRNLHICVTSRPELDIQTILEPLTPHTVSLHDESGQKQDIADYVSSFVHSDRKMKKWRDEDKDLVIKTLPEKADGMFRWVFCQLEALRHCFPPSVRQILGELPESLDDTYERILKEIRRPNQGHSHRLMQCLVAAVRPLRVEELAEVLAFDFTLEGTPKLNPDWRWEDQEEAVMSACSSLVIVVKNENARIVQFSHFSVKEFLTSSRLAESSMDVSRYHIPLEGAHTILAQACLGVLLRLDDRIDHDTIKNFPLAQYAAEHWFKHAQFEKVALRIKDGMECLFDADRSHFATWLWICDPEYYGPSMTTMSPSRPEVVPLYYAALFGFRDLTELLLIKHPEDVHAKGGYEVTPLHASARHGHADIFLLLVEHFPKVDIQGICLQIPLHRASRGGHIKIGQWLLDRGAGINTQDKDGWTPLFIAAIKGRLEFARMLLERGAAIDVPNKLGETPLHVASESGHVEVVRLLLDRGADLNACDKILGDTPFEVASSYGHREIGQLLSEYSPMSAKR